MIHRHALPVRELAARRGLSQRALATEAGISRGCLRQILQGDHNLTLRSLEKVARSLDRELSVALTQRDVLAEYSTIAIALKVEREGFASWKIHFMDFVDEFRRTLDPRLACLPPHTSFDQRLTALLASMVTELCTSHGITVPGWARRRYYLRAPWFVADVQSLKASALVESPWPYRNNNIFVHDNFLARA